MNIVAWMNYWSYCLLRVQVMIMNIISNIKFNPQRVVKGHGLYRVILLVHDSGYQN